MNDKNRPMANPQKELGHIEIANDLWEALCRAEIPGRQRRVLDAIIRKTWGWHKKSDLVALSQIEKMTGIGRTNVCVLLKWLKAANMITRDEDGRTAIQKDFEAWLVPPAVVPPKVLPSTAGGTSRRRKSASTARDNRLVPPAVLSKDTLTKDTLTKDTPRHSDDGGTMDEKKIIERTPLEQVLDAFYLKLNPHLNFAIKFIQEVGEGDQFAPTITTPYQLKEKFASLVRYAQRKQAKAEGGTFDLDSV
jgi:phage replication O-like protein O